MASRSAGVGRGERILVIEDDQPIAELYATELKFAGFSVATAYNGADGLAAAVTEKPDAILLDIILPELDGFDVLQRLKADPKTAAIPVFLLSNLSLPEHIERGKALGAVDYLVKADHIPSDIVARLGKLFSVHP